MPKQARSHDQSATASEAAARLGAVGGSSGRGKSKARPPEHYARLVEIRKKNREKKKK